MGKDNNSGTSNIVYKEDIFPPGYYFLVRTFPFLVLPPLIVHSVHLLVAPPILSSLLVRIPAYFLSIPLYIAVGEIWRNISGAREARRLGAVLVPAIHGKLPGNFDVVKELEKGNKEDYCGVKAAEMAQEWGNTHSMKIFWGNEVGDILPIRLMGSSTEICSYPLDHIYFGARGTSSFFFNTSH